MPISIPFFLLAIAPQTHVSTIQDPSPGDFAALPWTEAFDALHKKIAAEYAFTPWRRINWTALRTKFRPQIAAAQTQNDFDAYYLALREYLWSIPDGHVGVTIPAGVRAEHIGGGYGFAVAGLDDGRVIANIILRESAAFKAGLRRGAEILSINGKPTAQAVRETSVLWTGAPPATHENRLHEQHRYVTRAPIGTEMTLSFRNPGEKKSATITVAAIDDALETLARTAPTREPFNENDLVRHRILPGNIGYLWIRAEMGDALAKMTTAMQEFTKARVSGLVVDLRANVGGDDEMAADMSAFFHGQPLFYEYAQYFNPKTETFDIVDSTRITVTPREPQFTKPVIALIGPGTGSSGEGVAWMIQRARNGRTMGFGGTNGSFGMAGQTAAMPGDIVVHYPHGASVDQKGRVQLDSDHTGKGGVAPDIRVPRTYKNLMNLGEGRDVLLEDSARMLREKK
jgi:carboxyl-terminal processing protease